jgi:hypothetical protein
LHRRDLGATQVGPDAESVVAETCALQKLSLDGNTNRGFMLDAGSCTDKSTWALSSLGPSWMVLRLQIDDAVFSSRYFISHDHS